MLTRLARWCGFFVVGMALAPLGAADVADGVAVGDVLYQMESNSADFENLYMKTEVEFEADPNSPQAPALPGMTTEFWVFYDENGDRKTKFYSHGRFPFMYLINLSDLKIEYLTMSGGIKQVELPEGGEEILRGLLSKAGSQESEDANAFSIVREPSLDQAGTELAPALLPEGQADTQGLTDQARPKRRVGQRRAGLFERLNRGSAKRFRRQLKPWKGKRVRGIRLLPKERILDPAKAEKDPWLVGRIERKIDMASGLILQEDHYDVGGRRRLSTRVRTFKERSDGVMVPETSETVLEQNDGKVVKRKDRTLANEVNRVLSADERSLKIPEHLKSRP